MASPLPSLDLLAARADMHVQHDLAWRRGDLAACDLIEVELTELSQRLHGPPHVDAIPTQLGRP